MTRQFRHHGRATARRLARSARPATVRHAARDWLTELHLVAAGTGITTATPTLLPAVPPGVRLVPVEGVAEEVRRVGLVRMPGPLGTPAQALARALRQQAADLAD
ncbi:transcriptional regulator [Streptomyces sp. JH14]|uniref:transcriptional regulator n=1 Tax=Streptomyces sp. JH14 TaxID=2793630 RepID=UPI0023F77802|nr:transcriptional regulator [Streptomyces sp. JH14]MDF6046415.1 transcriptional regulator [Streptomyces sp. JH14]